MTKQEELLAYIQEGRFLSAKQAAIELGTFSSYIAVLLKKLRAKNLIQKQSPYKAN